MIILSIFEKIKKVFQLFIREHNFFILFFIIALLNLFVLQIFSPGIMSADSLYQWEQASYKTFSNSHPYLYTYLISILRMVYDSPIIVAIFQILVFSFLISFIINYYIKKGYSAIYSYLVLFIYLFIFPFIFIYNITLWKDVLYSYSILSLCLIWILINDTSSARKQILLAIIFVLIGGSITFIRHNGVIYLLIIPVLLLLVKRFTFRKYLILNVLLFSTYFFFSVLFFNFLGVKDNVSGLMSRSSKVYLISGIIKAGGALTEDEKILMSKIMPLDDLVKRYHCSSLDYLFYGKGGVTEKEELFLDKNFTREFDQKSNQIIIRNLPHAFGERVCTSLYLLSQGAGSSLYIYHIGIDDNNQGLRSENANSEIWVSIVRYLDLLKEYPYRIFFYNHLLYLAAYTVIFIYALYKRNIKLIGYVLIVCSNFIVLSILSPANHFRYLYMLPVCLIFLPFLIHVSYKKIFMNFRKLLSIENLFPTRI